MSILTEDASVSIRAALLRFYDEFARDLPWRRTRDPYAVWISEVMAQQTRVATAATYYERWIEQFPTLESLAGAELDVVLKAWEGLGYYSRARNLHRAAMLICERHAGTLPDSVPALRALPGVGEYTAGAVASIAYDRREPAIDGNVRRVLARLLDEAEPSHARIRDAAASLVPEDRPGDFNQALMELGATVCTPRAPRCDPCPIAAHCAAHAAGTQLERPRPKARPAVPVVDVATAVLQRRDGRLLIVRRPSSGLLAGLWEFPGLELAPGSSASDQALDIARRYAHECSAPEPLCTVDHVFSHRRERYDCYIIGVSRPRRSTGTAWIETDRTPHALPRAQQRIRASALDARRGSGRTRAAEG